jgi:hypothetical protein
MRMVSMLLVSCLAALGGCVEAGEVEGDEVASALDEELADDSAALAAATDLAASKVDALAASIEVPFHCNVTGSNRGCEGVAVCPSGVIVGAVAACNLEFGRVTESYVDSLPVDLMVVQVPSDNVSSGLCRVGGNSIQRGSRLITGLDGERSTTFACKEYDRNGGDCEIRGKLFCSN